MKRIRIIEPDGTVRIVPYDKKRSLDLLQEAVGGYIERVPYTQNCWLNEEGLLKRLPWNKPGRDEAHKLIPKKYRASMDAEYPFYAGNVAIVEDAP